MKIISIFLSSPGDAALERAELIDVIENQIGKDPAFRERIHFNVVSWDDPRIRTPMFAEKTPQDSIEEQLRTPSECDLAIFVLKARLGTILPDYHKKSDGNRYSSGTEYEFLDAQKAALESGSPQILIYRDPTPPSFSIDENDSVILEAKKQWFAVEEFCSKFELSDGALNGIVTPYSGIEDFRDLVHKNVREYAHQFLSNDLANGPRLNRGPTASRAKLSTLRSAMRAELDFMDDQTNHQSEWFAPLEAKVLVRKGGANEVSDVSNLLTALRNKEHDKLGVVLGLPGAGKSVAMREYVRQRIDTFKDGDRTPIYINLRDWSRRTFGDGIDEPGEDSLIRFLSEQISIGVLGKVEYSPDEVMSLHLGSKFFWVFDSFDEIPAILDAGEGLEDEIVSKYSKLLFDFVAAGESQDSQHRSAIIASRYERKPRLPNSQYSLIDIQPFSDDLIRDAFLKVEQFPETLIDDLFRPPGTLVPIARTPFYHKLICDYVKDSGALPENASDLFDNFVRSKLSFGEAKFDEDQLEKCQDTARQVAFFLFENKDFGLAAPRDEIETHLQSHGLASNVDHLVGAELLRGGERENGYMHFAHRRIHEYFFVRYKIESGMPFDIDWVAQDPRAVLHVEIAKPDEAQRIAESCWREVVNSKGASYYDPEFFRGLHCLRFLAEAFRTRRSALHSFTPELERYVFDCLEHGDDIIVAKRAAECVGLLPESGIERAVSAALMRADFWIRETTLDACRFLPALSPDVRGHIWRSVAFMSDKEFMREIDRLEFSFKLSPNLEEVHARLLQKKKDVFSWHRYLKWILLSLNLWWLWLALLQEFILKKFQDSNPQVTFDNVSLGTNDFLKLYVDPLEARRRIEVLHLRDENDSSEMVLKSLNIVSDYEVSIVVSPTYKTKEPAEGAFFRAALGKWIWVNNKKTSALTRLRALVANFQYRSYVPIIAAYMILFLALNSPSSVAENLSTEPKNWSGYVLNALLVVALAGQYFARRGYSLILEDEVLPKIFQSKIDTGGLLVFFQHVERWFEARLANLKEFLVFLLGCLFLFVAFALLFGISYSLSLVYYWAVVRFNGAEKPSDELVSELTADIGIALFFGGILVSVAANAYFSMRDFFNGIQERKFQKQLLRAALNDDTHSREAIAFHIEAMLEPNHRSKYVDKLSRRGMAPTGQWPDGRPPNKNDDASTRLAVLEAKWLGLE